MVFQHFSRSEPFCNSIQPIDPFRNFPVTYRKCRCVCTIENHNVKKTYDITMLNKYHLLNWCTWQCCNLSGGVALIVWFTTNGMCVKNNTIIYVARASNSISKRDCEHDLYCCLLPWCEALRICRSGFPIASAASVRRPVANNSLKTASVADDVIDWPIPNKLIDFALSTYCKTKFLGLFLCKFFIFGLFFQICLPVFVFN